jgi:hypothetical protein
MMDAPLGADYFSQMYHGQNIPIKAEKKGKGY